MAISINAARKCDLHGPVGARGGPPWLSRADGREFEAVSRDVVFAFLGRSVGGGFRPSRISGGFVFTLLALRFVAVLIVVAVVSHRPVF